MKPSVLLAPAVLFAICTSSCNNSEPGKTPETKDTAVVGTATQQVSLPEPFATKSVKNYSKVVPWPAGKTPVAPPGFTVSKYADALDNPRWIYVAPNGDVLVAQANTETKGVKKVMSAINGKSKSQNESASSNQITLFRDTNKDGKFDVREIFLSGLNRPLGMLVLNNSFYVANTDGLWQFPYDAAATRITAKGKQLIELPAGGYNNHWTRNIIANAEGSKIYISVGSGSNVGENGMNHEVRRANILEVSPDGTGERVYASGLRNPVGLAWAPGTNTLWTAVNERDELGDDLVPDYITSVKEGAFYGWPYSYFGQHEDPRRKGERPDLVEKSLVPDVALGAHTASLGLAFYDKKNFPAKYQQGAFVGQHGSWNRSKLSGYKVVFVPFSNGKPSGDMEDFLTGFIANDKEEVYGRPVGVATSADGALLVADDAGNTIWKVSASK